MKKAILLLVMPAIAFRLLSADIVVTFTATGAASVVDEVTALNLTTNESVVLPGNAALTLHQASTGIQMLSDGSVNGTIYPNPSFDKTELMLSLKENQTVRLQVINPDGKMLCQKSQYLPGGNHLYTLTSGDPGIYLINVVTKAGSSNYKFMRTGENSGENSILYEGTAASDKMITGQIPLKNAEADYQLNFALGDIMLYTCKSGNYRTIITDSPVDSKTYTVEFIPCTDRDSNNYAVVKIGDQWWMAENLKTTRYRNGDTIPRVTDTMEWMNLSSDAYCNYYNDTNNSPVYGKLYNWFAVTDSANIAPEGWHVSNDGEWQVLIDYLGGYDAAAGKMKETGTVHWASPNTGATNKCGFTGLPGGSRGPNGVFYDLHDNGMWWTSTIKETIMALIRSLHYNDNMITSGWGLQQVGLSVRCVRDK